MKIIPIFDTGNQSLLAVKYNGDPEDIFYMLFKQWRNVGYLEDFFSRNISDLTSGFYGIITVKEAVSRTMQDAKELSKQLMEIQKEKPKAKSLDDFFKPLDKITYKPDDVEKTKAYGVLEGSWIRLYAIKLPDNCFIVTGGTIKLTRTMQERPHTQKELDNLDRCRDFLRSQGIIDDEGIKEISE